MENVDVGLDLIIENLRIPAPHYIRRPNSSYHIYGPMWNPPEVPKGRGLLLDMIIPYPIPTEKIFPAR